MKSRALLIDVDGVLSIHDQSFSRAYAQKQSKDYAHFRKFFQGEFQEALIGKADLKQLIQASPHLWGNVDATELLTDWLHFEAQLNQPLLEAVAAVRAKGVRCYIATNQEQYRGEYIQRNMFPSQFDGYFISSSIGSKKPDRAFFRHAIASMQKDTPKLRAAEILFLDDSPEHITGAAQAGIDAHLYTNLADAVALLHEKFAL